MIEPTSTLPPNGNDLLEEAWDDVEDESGDSPEDLADEVHAKPRDAELWPEDEDEADEEAEAVEAGADEDLTAPDDPPPDPTAELEALQAKVAELEAQVSDRPRVDIHDLLSQVDTVEMEEADAIDLIQALMYKIKPNEIDPQVALDLERKKLDRESKRRLAEIEAERAKFLEEKAAKDAEETENRYQAYLRDAATRSVTNTSYPAITTWFAGEDEVTEALGAIAAAEVRAKGAEADLRADRLLTLLERHVKSRLERAGKLKPRPPQAKPQAKKPQPKERARANNAGRQAISDAFDSLFGPE